MEPKSELLVFSKKEIAILISLLVLVAAFSFTIGLRLGKTLGVVKAIPEEHAPLAEKKEIVPAHEAANGALDADEKAILDEEEGGKEAPKAESEKTATKTADPQHQQVQIAENHADTEFNEESTKHNVAVEKPMPMSLPKEKKREASTGTRYTLQVGAHRTVAEAVKQVGELKHQELDAFYLEAKVPGRGTWYRVGIGLFSTKDEAERTALQWKSTKVMPSFIVQKINE